MFFAKPRETIFNTFKKLANLEVQRTLILQNLMGTFWEPVLVIWDHRCGHSIWSTTVMSVCCQCLTLNKDLFLLCGSLTNVTSIQKYLQSLPVCCPLTFHSSQQIRKHTSAFVWNSILLYCYLFSMYSFIENVLDVHLPKCAVYAQRAHCIPQCNALNLTLHFQIHSLAWFQLYLTSGAKALHALQSGGVCLISLKDTHMVTTL